MFGALKSSRMRKARGSAKPATRRWPALRVSAAALISIANRVEARASKNASIEITNASEVLAARELIRAQEEFLKAIQTVHNAGVDWSEIKTQHIRPVLENSIVGDLAWLTINQMIMHAERAGRR